MNNTPLSKDDYEEPRCLLDMHPEEKPIPVDRVIEKLDSYLEKNDYSAAERHLSYWLEEAKAGHDGRGRLTVLNEQIGLYRKTGKEAECFNAISEALSLVDALGMGQSVTCATTLINAATGYKAFDKPSEALPLYLRAQIIYESELDPTDGRLGGLYNNMALTLASLKDYSKARICYDKALDIMKLQKYGELETAITLLNLADLTAAETGSEAGAEDIENYVLKAADLLNTEGIPRNGYYAFVCEKCAPVFGHYGFFLIKQDLEKRARDIYDRT